MPSKWAYDVGMSSNKSQEPELKEPRSFEISFDDFLGRLTAGTQKRLADNGISCWSQLMPLLFPTNKPYCGISERCMKHITSEYNKIGGKLDLSKAQRLD